MMQTWKTRVRILRHRWQIHSARSTHYCFHFRSKYYWWIKVYTLYPRTQPQRRGSNMSNHYQPMGTDMWEESNSPPLSQVSLKASMQQCLLRNKWKVLMNVWTDVNLVGKKFGNPKVQVSKSWLRMEGRSIPRWLIHILGKLVLVVHRVAWFPARWISS